MIPNKDDGKKTLSDRLDGAIGIVAPVWAARRQAARYAMRMGATYFRGARSSRLSYNWSTGQESADTTLYAERQTLVDRSRDLNRNNPIAAGVTDTFCSNVVQTGIKPQSRVRTARVPATPEQIRQFQRDAELVWEKWSPWADAREKLTIEEIQDLALRQILESGEFLGVRRALDAVEGRPYMLALDIIEPDRLETPGNVGDPTTRFGVQMNDRGRAEKYHIRRSHPGDTFRTKEGAYDYVPVPARDSQGRPIVFHLFPVKRPGQSRGIPFFSPVIEYFKSMADYLEATIVTARIAACFSAFIKKENPYQSALAKAEATESSGKRLESLEPGVIEYLGPNEEITFAKPEQPGTTFDQFTEKLIRMIGAALGLPYELVIKDFSKTNYSSARAALLQSYRVFKVWQQLLINHLLQPSWEILLEEAWLRGELRAPGFQKYRWEWTRALWVPPGWQWVDPLKEVQANQHAVEMGFKTHAGVASEQGDDWESIAEQRAVEKKRFADLGLPWPGVPTTSERNSADTDETDIPEGSKKP